jgi:peptidoglycan hydrolase-like protein with peptidoglycan-binding domain
MIEAATMARSLLSRACGGRPGDAIGILAAVTGVAAVLINALYLQPSPHPAPMFAIKPPAAGTAHATAGHSVRLPRPRPGELAKGEAGVRSRADVIADVQRELERRGFYDGPLDGFHGPRTDAAIRDFEQAAGLKPSGEPNDELLQAIARSPVKAPAALPQRSTQISASARGDAIGDLIAASPKRVLAVQRALGDFGYGPVKPTGVPGADTRAAIEKFERERKLPITGQISDRLVRELAVVTGRPLE